MKKVLLVTSFLLAFLLSFSSMAQNIPLDMKNWYSQSRNGFAPVAWPTDGSYYVRNTGLRQTAAGTSCMASADPNCSLFTVPGPGGIWEVRIRDGNGAALADVITPNADGLVPANFLNLLTGSFLYGYYRTGTTWDRVMTDYFPANFAAGTYNGIYTVAGNYYWDSGLGFFERWNGSVLSADALVAANTRAPYTGAFNYALDQVNNTWDRVRADANGNLTVNQTTSYPGYGRIQDGDGTTLADVGQYVANYAATVLGLQTVAGVYFYDATNADMRRWTGSQNSGETIATSFLTPYVQNMNYGYDATGAVWRWQNVEAAQADGKATSLNGLVTSSILYAYNGATLDMLRVGAVGELQVTDVATRPGEDAANDWRKVKKQAIATYTPAKETSGSIGTAAVLVLAAKEVMGYPNWCVWLQNDDVADPFTDADVQVSPDNSTWVSLTWTTCDTLATGLLCVFCTDENAYRYVRVYVAAADANPVSSVDAWITANVD